MTIRLIWFSIKVLVIFSRVYKNTALQASAGRFLRLLHCKCGVKFDNNIHIQKCRNILDLSAVDLHLDQARAVNQRLNRGELFIVVHKYIVQIQIMDTKKVKDLEVATKVSVQLQLTDPEIKSRDRIVKKSEKDSLYAAMDLATIWLERALSNK